MKHIHAVLGISLMLVSCGPRMPADGPPPAGLAAEDVRYTTQVTAGRCVMEPAGEAAPILAGLATALLSSAISQGVTRIGTVLQESAQADVRTVTAWRNVEVTNGTFGPCLQIARGWFHTAPPKIDATEQPAWAVDSFLTGGRHVKLWRNGLWLADAPDFYFEGGLRPSEDLGRLTVEPLFVRLDEPIATRLLRPGGEREVLVSFGFLVDGMRPDLSKNPGATIVIGELAPGRERRFPAGDRLVTEIDPTSDGTLPTPTAGASGSGADEAGLGVGVPGFGPAPPPDTAPAEPVPSTGSGAPVSGFIGGGGQPDLPLDAGPTASVPPTLVRSPLESEWFTLSLPTGRRPMSIGATVSETQGKSEFLSFVAAVFKEKEADIATALQTAIIPSRREEAEAQAQSAQDTIDNGYDSAFVDARNALSSCAQGGGDTLQNAVNARNKMRILNQKSRAAGKGTPFGESDIEDIDLAAEGPAVSAACRRALVKLQA